MGEPNENRTAEGLRDLETRLAIAGGNLDATGLRVTRMALCDECGGDGYCKGPRLGDEPCAKCRGFGVCRVVNTGNGDAN